MQMVRVETSFCVYAHSKHGTVFYVGMGSAERAFTRAARSAAWLAYVDTRSFDVTILRWFETEEAARAAEAKAIRKLKPECNAVHNRPYLTLERRAEIGRKRIGTGKPIPAVNPTSPSPRWVAVRCVETGVEFPNAMAAAREMRVCVDTVRRSVKGQGSPASVFHFERI